MMDLKVIAVHSGPFHADDAFAVATLKLLYPKTTFIRTRDPEVLKKADMRVDVGRLYDPKTNDFDHHQKGGAGKRENGTPYAAAGLIWKHFGDKLAGKEVQEYLDKRIIQYVDADDNGVDVYKSDIELYTIAEFIEGLNPHVTESSYDSFDKLFFETVEIIVKLLKAEIQRADLICKSKDIVRKKIKETKKEYIVLEDNLPWRDVVINESKLLFVIRYNNLEDNWGISAVPVSKDSFENRKDLPKSWGGLDNQALQNVTGVKDAIFCHNKLFMAIAKSKEGALKLVEMALENKNAKN